MLQAHLKVKNTVINDFRNYEIQISWLKLSFINLIEIITGKY